jgi:hypothetical protein
LDGRAMAYSLAMKREGWKTSGPEDLPLIVNKLIVDHYLFVLNSENS